MPGFDQVMNMQSPSDTRKINSWSVWFGDVRIWVLCLCFLAAGILSLNDVFLYTPDSARYLLWSDSLASLRGFVDDSGPDPVSYVVHAPLYPFFLMPASFMSTGNVSVAKSLQLAYTVFFLILLYGWTSRKLGRTAAWWGTVFIAINPLVILYSTQLLSEIPFLLLLLVVCMLLEKVLDQTVASQPARDRLNRPDDVNLPLAILAVVLAGTVLLRETGFSLVLALVVFFTRRKEFLRAAVVLVLPVALYSLWHIRNELIVASIEHPGLRNADLMFSHLFTSDNASFAEELVARIQTNFSVSWKPLLKLLFLTQYDPHAYSVVNSSDNPFAFVAGIAPFLLQFPLMFITLGLIIFGWFTTGRTWIVTRFIVLFVAFYGAVILIYPFNDVRFLFPLVFPCAIYSIAGAKEVWRRASGLWRRSFGAGYICLAVLALPNLAWTIVYLQNVSRYCSDPVEFVRSVDKVTNPPELLMLSASRIGKWICSNSDSEAVIASRWKQLAFWFQGRKLLELDPYLPLRNFEAKLRDYRVRFLVSHIDRTGLRDAELQMALSGRYQFTPVFRAGRLVILRVAESTEEITEAMSTERDDPQYGYRAALALLRDGKAAEAGLLFRKLRAEVGTSGAGLLYEGIADSFVGRFNEAREKLNALREAIQSGQLLFQASYHLQTIGKLEQAIFARETLTRANLFTNAAFMYWELGYRRRAREILDSALATNPSFSPALVFDSYFRLEMGDLNGAAGAVRILTNRDPGHPMVAPLKELIACTDSLAARPPTAHQSRLLLRRSQAFQAMGLIDNSVDDMVRLLEKDRRNAVALRRLAEFYITKRRIEPALRTIARLAEIDPADSDVAKMSEALDRIQY